MAQKVGFIGLGQMGGPMAANMARNGFKLTVYDPVQTAVQTVVQAGAEAAAGSAEVARQADVVITMLPNSPQVKSVVLGEVLPNIAPGGLIMDMSTIEPLASDEVAAAVRAAGRRFVDAPVGRTTDFAVRGQSLFMVGAEPQDYETVLPMLQAMGDTIIHCGGPGSGVRVKIVNNFVAIGHVQLNAEALTLGAALGLKVETMLSVMTGTLATNGFLTTGFPNKTLKGDITPGFKMDLAHKDLSIALETGQRLKVPLPMGASMREAINYARARGFGDNDFTALLDSEAELAGVAKPQFESAPAPTARKGG